MAESSTGRHGEAGRGIARGLTHYGDPDFSLFIRGAYARGAGLTAEPLLALRHRQPDHQPLLAELPYALPQRRFLE